MSDVFDAIAAEFDPYIAKLLPVPFAAQTLRNAVEWDSKFGIRSVAVAAVDMYHGFTCEFSPWPQQHAGEYDTLEELLIAAFPDGLSDAT